MDFTTLFDLPWGPLLIFGLRVADVSLDTMRVLFAVRGKRYHAASLGFFQALIFILVVGNVITHLDSFWHVLGYAGGFAAGTLVGVMIENAVAYGLSTVRIVSPHGGVEIAAALRERGYGATEVSGYGRDGTVEIVDSVVHRSHLDEIMDDRRQVGFAGVRHGRGAKDPARRIARRSRALDARARVGTPQGADSAARVGAAPLLAQDSVDPNVLRNVPLDHVLAEPSLALHPELFHHAARARVAR